MWFLKKNERQKKIEPSVPEQIANHPAWLRLEQQISWYDTRSRRCQSYYKTLKFLQIFLAVSIPLVSHLDPGYAKWLTSTAGALIAILEAIQHMNQYAMLWVSYRATTERLKHEKYLFLSAAGPYKALPDVERLVVLAERVEEHVSTEHANWINDTRRNVTTSKQEPTHR